MLYLYMKKNINKTDADDERDEDIEYLQKEVRKRWEAETKELQEKYRVYLKYKSAKMKKDAFN